jgi:shikimate kinase/thiamine monophosphate synthase
VLNLPPLYPVTDAGLEPSLSDQVRALGAVGFPLVQFRGEPLPVEIQWQELRRALAEAWENGGWPAICVRGSAALALRALSEDRPPWGLHLDMGQGADPQFQAQGLALGTTAAGPGAWERLDPAWSHAGVGPFRGEAAALGYAGFKRGCAHLRGKGILPIAFGGLTLQDAGHCYRAGAESLALSRELLCAPEPAELLWQAQRLRWRTRPPFRTGQGIALVGGSGCGKSTLARKLGERLRMPVRDLDAVIVERAGKSIARIFAEEGEPRFRELEREVTCAAFQSEAILALGGGAWESEAVRQAARASGCAVLWIAENPGVIWRRVGQDPSRPLAQDRATFLARWRVRMPRWMEAPMLLPLGRGPGRLADALVRSRG